MVDYDSYMAHRIAVMEQTLAVMDKVNPQSEPPPFGDIS